MPPLLTPQNQTKNRVRVYRTLRHGRNAPPLYSVLQGGRVIMRVRQILLQDCRFIVREAGRQRTLRDRRKNVHAFVEGVPAPSAFGIDATGEDLPAKLRYNPYEGPYFTWEGRPVQAARAVLLNKNGISATYLS